MLSLPDTVEIWDITGKMAPQNLVTHSVASISGDVKLGDVIAILTNNEAEGVTLWAFDLKNWQAAPKQIDHPIHRSFQEQEEYLSNSTQLFLRGEENKLVAFKAANGTLKYQWELTLSKEIRCAGEKWLLAPFRDASWAFQHTVETINTETGHSVSIKKFQDGTFASSHYLCHYLWGHSVLVSVDFEVRLSFWHLPSWRKLGSYAIDGSNIHDISCQQDALLLLHKNSATNTYRAQRLCPSTQTHIRAGSFWDTAYGIFTSFCSWLQSLLEYFCGKRS
jgi:hypothetical protein